MKKILHSTVLAVTFIVGATSMGLLQAYFDYTEEVRANMPILERVRIVSVDELQNGLHPVRFVSLSGQTSAIRYDGGIRRLVKIEEIYLLAHPNPDLKSGRTGKFQLVKDGRSPRILPEFIFIAEPRPSF